MAKFWYFVATLGSLLSLASHVHGVDKGDATLHRRQTVYVTVTEYRYIPTVPTYAPLPQQPAKHDAPAPDIAHPDATNAPTVPFASTYTLLHSQPPPAHARDHLTNTDTNTNTNNRLTAMDTGSRPSHPWPSWMNMLLNPHPNMGDWARFPSHELTTPISVQPHFARLQPRPLYPALQPTVPPLGNLAVPTPPVLGPSALTPVRPSTLDATTNDQPSDASPAPVFSNSPFNNPSPWDVSPNTVSGAPTSAPVAAASASLHHPTLSYSYTNAPYGAPDPPSGSHSHFSSNEYATAAAPLTPPMAMNVASGPMLRPAMANAAAAPPPPPAAAAAPSNVHMAPSVGMAPPMNLVPPGNAGTASIPMAAPVMAPALDGDDIPSAAGAAASVSIPFEPVSLSPLSLTLSEDANLPVYVPEYAMAHRSSDHVVPPLDALAAPDALSRPPLASASSSSSGAFPMRVEPPAGLPPRPLAPAAASVAADIPRMFSSAGALSVAPSPPLPVDAAVDAVAMPPPFMPSVASPSLQALRVPLATGMMPSSDIPRPPTPRVAAADTVDAPRLLAMPSPPSTPLVDQASPRLAPASVVAQPSPLPQPQPQPQIYNAPPSLPPPPPSPPTPPRRPSWENALTFTSYPGLNTPLWTPPMASPPPVAPDDVVPTPTWPLNAHATATPSLADASPAPVSVLPTPTTPLPAASLLPDRLSPVPSSHVPPSPTPLLSREQENAAIPRPSSSAVVASPSTKMWIPVTITSTGSDARVTTSTRYPSTTTPAPDSTSKDEEEDKEKEKEEQDEAEEKSHRLSLSTKSPDHDDLMTVSTTSTTRGSATTTSVSTFVGPDATTTVMTLVPSSTTTTTTARPTSVRPASGATGDAGDAWMSAIQTTMCAMVVGSFVLLLV
ncbi:hypothetical protein BGZ73_001771 [Actinomortierella ambigua]|nr:hypothetical protein BGZ73_001771 [Actinomortierella ambigua]